MKYRCFLLLGFISLHISSCTSNNDQRYYCNHIQPLYGNKSNYIPPQQYVSWTDNIVVVTGEKNQHKLDILGNRKKLYRTYNEGDVLTSVHKNDAKFYKISRLDLSSDQAVFIYGYGRHFTYEEFEKGYQIPFSKKTLGFFNRNPELIKYLPPKPTNKEDSLAFFKFKQICTPMNVREYFYKAVLLFIVNVMSAG